MKIVLDAKGKHFEQNIQSVHRAHKSHRPHSIVVSLLAGSPIIAKDVRPLPGTLAFQTNDGERRTKIENVRHVTLDWFSV